MWNKVLNPDVDDAEYGQNVEKVGGILNHFFPWLIREMAAKIDKLGALTKKQQEYQEGNIICFNETWLQERL